jgi:hypothetical protein
VADYARFITTPRNWSGNGMTGGEGQHFDRKAANDARELNDARARAVQAVSPDDVLDELTLFEDELRAAGDDAAAIGAVYLKARAGLIERLATGGYL